MKRTLQTITLAILLIASNLAVATNYYCDPVSGSMSNTGTQASPWGSLHDVFSSGKTFVAGDVLLLLNGQHGEIYLTGMHTGYVTIMPFPGHTPKIASAFLQNTSYWAFDNLTFTSDGTGGTYTRNYLFYTKPDVTYTRITNCQFYSAENSDSWTKADWYANTTNAAQFEGDYVTFEHNTIKNIYHGIFFSGDYSDVKYNTIENFGADAMRALSSNSVYENNTIKNAYIEQYADNTEGHPEYLANHDDAIQMYDADDLNNGVIKNVIIRNNYINFFEKPITQAMIDDDLVGYSMQGIFITDGHTEEVIVENNLVINDQYHGITLMGAINCVVQNNTVIKTPQSISGSAVIPWIQLTADKNGNECHDNIIRNNIASKLTPWTYDNGYNIVAENNLEPAAAQYTSYFVDYVNHDFHLLETSPAVDAGINTNLSATDLDGNLRLVNGTVDCGAYEYHLSCSEIKASTYQNDPTWGVNPPANAFDGDMDTKWAADGIGEWIQKSFCESTLIKSVNIAFGVGDTRTYDFTIELSTDGTNFSQVYSGTSEMNLSLQNFDFTDTQAKYIKIIANGNSKADNNWNNYMEIEIVSTTTSVEMKNIQAFSVYPNPSNGRFTINLSAFAEEKTSMKIYSITGKLVYTEKIEKGIEKQNFSLNLQKGIYFIELKNKTIKIVISK